MSSGIASAIAKLAIAFLGVITKYDNTSFAIYLKALCGCSNDKHTYYLHIIILITIIKNLVNLPSKPLNLSLFDIEYGTKLVSVTYQFLKPGLTKNFYTYF